jgi:hypothetical protein
MLHKFSLVERITLHVRNDSFNQSCMFDVHRNRASLVVQVRCASFTRLCMFDAVLSVIRSASNRPIGLLQQAYRLMV